MILIEIRGGLGNQMFQYAFYLHMRKHFEQVYLHEQKYRPHNGMELKRVFGIRYQRLNHTQADLLRGSGYEPTWKHTVMKCFMPVLGFPKSLEVCRDYEMTEQDIQGEDNKYYMGTWESEQYFEDVREEVLSQFDFSKVNKMDPSNASMREKIENCNAVSIHVRRGDFLNDANNKIHGNICTMQYYKNAVACLESRKSNLSYFVFSDDPEWVRENFTWLDYTLVEGNSGIDSYKDMWLMSCCRHHIIANSTFSWWGAYLNLDADKIVIRPSRFHNWDGYPDEEKRNKMDEMICPESWIIVES